MVSMLSPAGESLEEERQPTGAVFSLLWTQPEEVRGREHSRGRKTNGDLASGGEIQRVFSFSSALTFDKPGLPETGDFRQQGLWKHEMGFRYVSVE